MGATERRRAVTARDGSSTPRRDRRGRGIRGALIPRRHPAARNRSERFDALVLDEIDHLGRHCQDRITDVEFAVEEVPPALPEFDTDVIEDRTVPLSRLIRSNEPSREAQQPAARIVLYRRPLEARARHRDELANLVFDLLVEQVASLLGVDPDDIDPYLGR